MRLWILIGLSALPVYGTVIASTLGSSPTFGWVDHYDSSYRGAAPFVAPTDVYLLENVVLTLSRGNSGSTPVAFLDLYSDNAGTPGTLLTNLGFSTVTTNTASNYSFSPILSYSLTPGAQYWLVSRCSNCFQDAGLGIDIRFEWYIASSQNNGVALPGASMPELLGISVDAGASWGLTGVGILPPNDLPGGGLLFRVNGTLDPNPPAPGVPEPGTAVLVGAGIWLAGNIRKKI